MQKGFSLVYITMLFLFVLSSVLVFPVIALFIFPGILFYLFINLKRVLFAEKILVSIVLSLAFWISSFGLLKYLPINIDIFIYAVVAISLIITVIRYKNFAVGINIKKDDFIFILSLFVIAIPLTPFLNGLIVPSGADMATHSYIAKVIVENKSFPETYDPILPDVKFGSSPLGLPTLIAYSSLLSGLPVHTVGIYISFLSYILLAASIMFFLRNYFSMFISFLTVFSVFWIGQDIYRYVFWGGNTTILSLSFMIMAIVFLMKSYSKKFSFVSTFMLSLIVYASFSSHEYMLFIFGYYSIFLGILNAKQIVSKLGVYNLKFTLLLGVILLVFAIPYLTSISWPNDSVIERIKEEVRENHYIAPTWKSGSTVDSVTAIINYLVTRLGYQFTIIVLVGIILSSTAKKHKIKISKLMISLLFGSIILILNSNHWILPFSPLFFPDRVMTSAVLSTSFFSGILLEKMFNVNNLKNLRIWILSYRGISITFSLVAITYLLFKDVPSNYLDSIPSLKTFSSVKSDDLVVFNWISNNTTTNDVFLNNYGDAGIWIPSITFRRVMVNDSTLQDIEAIKNSSLQVKPNYLFVGSHEAYPESIQYRYNDVKDKPYYKLIVSSGNAHLFKILR